MNDCRSFAGSLFLLAVAMTALGAVSSARMLVADPNSAPDKADYYRNLARRLKPGDTLTLPAGVYRERLNLTGIQGSPNEWITITGPEAGGPAIVTNDSSCCNTVQLGNTSYVSIKNLTIDSNSEGIGSTIDGINAKEGPTHNILIENCVLTGLSYNQQTVGISTKSTAWNWTIRNNKILGAGTGLYLGNSDGSKPFTAGIIEGNLIVDSIGYNMEIKFQRPYSLIPGMPPGPNRTLIRNNVFIKRLATQNWSSRSDGSSRVAEARPNVLVGGFPDWGPGSRDLYEIYGNFFYKNPQESLLQASGRVSIHDNILVGASNVAIDLRNHDLPLKLGYVYNNTIYGGKVGISCQPGGPAETAIVGNLIFAVSPFRGSASIRRENLTDSVGNAVNYVTKPSSVLGQMDFYPLKGKCEGSLLDLSRFVADTGYNVDFNGRPKGSHRIRGAYTTGVVANPGWQLMEGPKPAFLTTQP